MWSGTVEMYDCLEDVRGDCVITVDCELDNDDDLSIYSVKCDGVEMDDKEYINSITDLVHEKALEMAGSHKPDRMSKELDREIAACMWYDMKKEGEI